MKTNTIIKTLYFCIGVSTSFITQSAQPPEDWRFEAIQTALNSNNTVQLEQALQFTTDAYGPEIIFDLHAWFEAYKQTNEPSETSKQFDTLLQAHIESFVQQQDTTRHEIPTTQSISTKDDLLKSLLKGQIDLNQYTLETGETMKNSYLELLKQHTLQAEADKPVREQIYTVQGDLANSNDTLSLVPTAARPEDQDTIILLPSLQQDLKSGSVGNYCGYYALFNAQCFANQRMDIRISRESFIAFLNNSINMIRLMGDTGRQKNLASENFGDLDIQEIGNLLDMMNIPNTVVIGTPNLFIANITDRPLEEILGEEREQTALPIEQFQQGSLNRLIIILGTGAHYFTVLAERNPSSHAITLRAADSLPGSSYDARVFESKILPLYYMLKGIPGKLTAATAEKFHVPIGHLAKNWTEFERQAKSTK